VTLVVDASVVVAALVDTDRNGVWAEGVLARGELVAPELLAIEVSNALRRLEQAKEISQSETESHFEALMALPVRYLPLIPLIDRVHELRHNATAYDASYVAAAEIMGASMATLDFRLAGLDAACEFLTPQ